MSKSKNRHYVSQCISKNFAVPDGPKNFWMYDCQTKQPPVVKNVDRLFSKRRIWDDSFEKLLSSNAFENKLAPTLKKLVMQELPKPVLRTDSGFTVPQFSGVLVTNTEDKNILSKLLLQPMLLQVASKSSDTEIEESKLDNFYQTHLESRLNITLMENNPCYSLAPFILMDNMLFMFLSPSHSADALGQVNFFFPISIHRFLLWTSTLEDCEFFCRKYSNIHELNLERIAQQNKECQIATQDKTYLDLLIQQVEKYQSKEQIVIQATRQW